MGHSLAIAIPTFNRPKILEENLAIMWNDILNNRIKVYICDDSTNNETKDLIEDLQKSYNNLFYTRNQPSLGHDRNCIRTLNLPTEDYIWYLGDSMIIKKNAISQILDIIEENKPNFISVNAEGRRLNLPSKIYTNEKELLFDLGWHITMTGATIYKRENLNLVDFNIKKFKNFPQFALIFENYNSNLYWCNEKLISSNKNKKSYWSDNIFSVFIHDYKTALSNLKNSFSEQEVNRAVRIHSDKTNILTYIGLTKYRKNKNFNRIVLKGFEQDIKKYSNVNGFFVKILPFIPACIIPKP